MAAAARPTPPPTQPAPPADLAPHTPTSISSTTALPIVSTKVASPAPAPGLPGAAYPGISPKTAYKAFSPRLSPRPLTGAAALADAQRAEEQQRSFRQSSPNPRFAAVNALLGHQATSKASDGPPAVRISEPLRHVMEQVAQPAPKTQPNGLSHASTTESPARHTPLSKSSAMTATAAPRHSIPELVEEPESMDEDGGEDSVLDNNTRPFTYPGPARPQLDETPSRRDLSYDSSSKSGAKRHKCPYCATDFTRHHNLKSHLLTHSQEKPYVCQTCNSRFRRLHDLKRHSKLHTGERPHICPKCGRKFARGDALARHNKGPGGCANRKSSFGGEDGDDDMDETMDGMEYDNDHGDDDDGELDDPSTRRVSEPSRKRARPEASLDADKAPYRQQSNTYPPPQMARMTRPDHTTMGPPSTVLSPNQRISAIDHSQMQQQPMESAHQPQYYSHPTNTTTYSLPHVTESPRPLSPRSQ